MWHYMAAVDNGDVVAMHQATKYLLPNVFRGNFQALERWERFDVNYPCQGCCCCCSNEKKTKKNGSLLKITYSNA